MTTQEAATRREVRAGRPPAKVVAAPGGVTDAETEADVVAPPLLITGNAEGGTCSVDGICA